MTNYIKQVTMPDGTVALVKDEEARTSKADKATTLSGYGITDAYTKEEVDALIQQGGGSSVSNISQGLLLNKTLVDGVLSPVSSTTQAYTISLDENTFKGIKTIDGGAMYKLKDTTVSDPLLATTHNISFNGAASYPDLETVKTDSGNTSNSGMYQAFDGCAVTSVSFPKLITIEENGMYSAFANTAINQEELRFTSLTTIQDCGLQETFSGANITIGKVYFPALTTVVGDALDGTFYLANVTEIHFRADMQTTVEALDAYAQKFGATNATVLFDL